MDINKLQQIEKDVSIKSKYLAQGTWGANNIMYAPVILVVIALFWLMMVLLFLTKDLPFGQLVMHIGGSVVVLVIGIAWFRYIKKGILKKSMERLPEFPVCLAKIVTGNFGQRLYYCIYTTGDKRLDISWLNNLSDRINNIQTEPNASIRSKIQSMFAPTMLALTTSEATKLPEAFTEGEPVYKRFFTLSGWPQKKIDAIMDNGAFIPVIVFNKISCPVIREEDFNYYE